MSVFEVFTKRLSLKLLSLLLAAVLWLFVSMEKEDELELTIPVTFVHLPADIVITDPVSPRVSARVTGATILLIRQQIQNPTLTLDLSGTNPGRLSFTALDQFVRLLPGLRVSRIQPASLDLMLSRLNSDNQGEK